VENSFSPAKMRREAMKLIQTDDLLRKRFLLLVSIPGIAEISAMHILSELALLAPEMTVRQWVAYSGLDPVHQVSGSSVHKPSRISRAGNRHPRRARRSSYRLTPAKPRSAGES